jgi:hypothetical protein
MKRGTIMEFETSTFMMIFFIIFMIIGIGKIYVFLPNKPLADDDTTKESQEELFALIIKIIKENKGNLNTDELFVKIISDENFNSAHYWRFNKNKLNQLLNSYYLKNPHAKSIVDIYEDLK